MNYGNGTWMRQCIQDRDDSITHRVEFPIQASRLITPSLLYSLVCFKQSILWFNLASSRNFCVHQAEPSVAFGRSVQVQARSREFLNIGNGWELHTGTQSPVPDSTQRRTRIKWNPEFFDLGLRLGAAFAFHLFLFQFSFKLRLPRARIAQAARELQTDSVCADPARPTLNASLCDSCTTRIALDSEDRVLRQSIAGSGHGRVFLAEDSALSIWDKTPGANRRRGECCPQARIGGSAAGDGGNPVQELSRACGRCAGMAPGTQLLGGYARRTGSLYVGRRKERGISPSGRPAQNPLIDGGADWDIEPPSARADKVVLQVPVPGAVDWLLGAWHDLGAKQSLPVVGRGLSLETTLPLDLERHIFELYAHWRPVSIPKLMLVAWRVKVWVEPILYRTLLVNNDDPIAGYPRFTAERVRCVRNVYLDDVGDTTLELLLSQCTGIENLWIRHDLDNLIPLFARLSLKDLYADIRPLLPALSPSHPFFSQITHLELIGGSVDPSPKEMGIWSGLAHLPRLTHLSFNDDDFIDICSPLLQSCKFLVVLICLEMASVDTEADDRAVEEGLQQDLRFVIMGCRLFRKDWQMGTHAGVDYWTRAEVQFRISEDSSEFIV
ncbi:hypothetical protein C8R43DRAFT_955516 [Mycena crocata]|nr:hypothetical protein C8R43DRAFT_955516 [Mycena crocata]